uniref:Tetraspanin n=1 Tax=Echinococcus granulosus TaxID=6210 RepID=A0A068WXL3_ECHGR|nr:tetraspanin [Echinococcus granulosus]
MSCSLHLLIKIPSYILSVTFLAIALLGIALEGFNSVEGAVIAKMLADFNMNSYDLGFLTRVASPNDHTGAALIVVGLLMTLVSFIGFYSYYFEAKVPLYIYTTALNVLLFSEAVVIAVYMANPDKLVTSFWGTLEAILRKYNHPGEDGPSLKSCWDTIMQADVKCNGHFYGPCCGMNNYTDFVSDWPWTLLPDECCKDTYLCTTSKAHRSGVPGCRDKITVCTTSNLKYVLSIAFATLLLQCAVALLPITYVFLVRPHQEDEEDSGYA